jgi:hypothetical protein
VCGYGLCDCASLARVCLVCITRVLQLETCVQGEFSEELFWSCAHGEERVWVQRSVLCVLCYVAVAVACVDGCSR